MRIAVSTVTCIRRAGPTALNFSSVRGSWQGRNGARGLVNHDSVACIFPQIPRKQPNVSVHVQCHAGTSNGGDGGSESGRDVEDFRAQLIASFSSEDDSNTSDSATIPAASSGSDEVGIQADAPKEPVKAWMKRKPIYLPFDEGRKWARAMGMGSRDEWEDWAYNSRRNPYIPRDPEEVYAAKGWESWDDWLGIVHYAPFEEARRTVRALHLQSIQEWFDACRDRESSKLPDIIPQQPNHVYRADGWVSFHDWLGIEEEEAPTRSAQ
mmetsp:Transcript_21321/g.40582  ORF Transcript_21321/g.40582 Transcript_21321/m.40582 type:complete len:267 (+) Transcript_21321:276-1076(+)